MSSQNAAINSPDDAATPTAAEPHHAEAMQTGMKKIPAQSPDQHKRLAEIRLLGPGR